MDRERCKGIGRGVRVPTCFTGQPENNMHGHLQRIAPAEINGCKEIRKRMASIDRRECRVVSRLEPQLEPYFSCRSVRGEELQNILVHTVRSRSNSERHMIFNCLPTRSDSWSSRAPLARTPKMTLAVIVWTQCSIEQNALVGTW